MAMDQQEFLASGSLVVGHLSALSLEMVQYQAELRSVLPDFNSWKHPEKARKAVKAQQDWSERSLQRNVMDYVDRCRDDLLSQLDRAGVADQRVDIHVPARNRNGLEKRSVTLRDVAYRNYQDARRSIMRHINAYFRQVRYFFEIQVTGGEIPPFPLDDSYSDRDEPRESPTRLPDSSEPRIDN